MHAHLRGEMPSTYLTSDIFVHIFGVCFVVDRYSHVRLHPLLRSTIISPNQVLIEPPSVAIWNRHKVAVNIAIGTWVIYVVFLIQGISFPSIVLQVMWNRANVFW
jgi:hypothetical protein